MDVQANQLVEEQLSTETPGTVRRRLGRGLHALLGGAEGEDSQNYQPAAAEAGDGVSPDPSHIHVELIERNPFQPRTEFEEEALAELTESIKQHGVLQPLLVRPSAGGYQLIAGERRWLAAKRAGIENVPCRVLELEDQQVCEVALEENLKRKDLHVLEKARAFKEYLDRFDAKLEDLAKQLSMNRSTLSNYLRLLDLPEYVRNALAEDSISNGHARALLTLSEEDQLALCKRIQSESLSVRKTEQAVRQLQQRDKPETIPFPKKDQSPPEAEANNHILSLQDQLRDQLGAKVQIRQSGKESGSIVIEFHSNDDFERIIRQLRRAE